MKIAVVIAAYQERENIGPLTERLVRTLSARADPSWRLIYVIDGMDETIAIAERSAAANPNIGILHSPEPSGLGAAFRRGFAAIEADTGVVVTMDADQNHQPEEIPRLVEALYSQQADIVVGSRYVKGSAVEGTPLWKRALSKVFSWGMRRFMSMPVWDQTSGYRVYRFEALQKIHFENDGFAFLPEILLRAQALGLRIVEEPIRFTFREAGDSKMLLRSTAASYWRLLVSSLRRRP